MQAGESHPRSRRALQGWRLAAARSGLLAASISLTLVGLELALRVCSPRIPSATVLGTFFEFDATTGWRGKPLAHGDFVTAAFDTHVTHDEFGWRVARDFQADEESSREAAGVSRRDIWCVGDSMTWGWGVNDGETFVDHLNRNAEPGTRFHNRGVPGYSSVQEYLLLKREFEASRRPDVVIVFFVPNDWDGNLPDDRRDPPQPWVEQRNGVWSWAGLPVEPTMGWPMRNWLTSNSRAFTFLNYHAKLLQQWRHQRSTMQRFNEASHDPTTTEQAALKFVYEQMQRLCHEYDVELVVACGFTPQPELASICQQLDLPLISAAAQRPADYDPHQVTADEALTFANDPHWSKRGHALVAKAVHTELSNSQPQVARRTNRDSRPPTSDRSAHHAR